MLRVGLVGVGGISGAHIPAWQRVNGASLVAICDIRPEQMSKWEGKISAKQYTSFDDMLANEDIDVLDICLPTYLHADFAVKAMNKGIHVICEKPISLRKEDVHRVYQCSVDNNVKFMIAHVLRFWPEYEFLKDVYVSKRYGKLLSGHMLRLSSYPNWTWENWMRDEKRSGLVPFDLHIHDLDFIVYTFGKPVNFTQRRSKQPNQDYMCMIYDFKDFFITAEASWYASCYPFRAEYRFQFEKAVLSYEGSGLVIYEPDGKRTDFQSEVSSNSRAINLPSTDAYFNEIDYFAKCVLYDRPIERVKEEELQSVLDIIAIG